jgi:nucleoside-diphosphate-sugar epimerase
MNVLVTGAGGFIGSNMVKYLLGKTEYQIFGIDDFSGGRKNEQLIKSLECGRFKFYEDNLTLSGELFKDAQIDVVFHFAATPRVLYSVEHPVETNENNVSNTLRLLDFCREKKVKRFVFSSSSSVYGDLVYFPTKEFAKKNPKSPYALQKSIIEEYCKIYSSLYNLDTVCLRYFNVYGPGQYAENAYATVISAWLKGFINNSEIRLDGDGLQSRDFSYVTDVCKANLLVGSHSENFNGEVFNVACNDSTSLLKVFEILKNITGNNPKVNRQETRLGDVKKTHADIDKIKDIGFNYDVSLEDGIKMTYEWYKNQ